MEECRYSPLILNLGNRWGEWSASHPGHFTAEEITYRSQRLGLRAGQNALKKRKNVDWINLAEDRHKWRDVVNAVMNLQNP
jgi:hypothetical protein